MDEVNADGWFRLAAAVVAGIEPEDPELEEWRRFGFELAKRIGAVGIHSRRLGNFDATEVETASRQSMRKAQNGSK